MIHLKYVSTDEAKATLLGGTFSSTVSVLRTDTHKGADWYPRIQSDVNNVALGAGPTGYAFFVVRVCLSLFTISSGTS